MEIDYYTRSNWQRRDLLLIARSRTMNRYSIKK